MGTASERQHAHELLEKLPPAEIATVVRFLEFMLLEAGFRAATLEEPVTDEDRRRFKDAQVWFAQRVGKGIPMEEVLADFDLKIDDFPLGK